MPASRAEQERVAGRRARALQLRAAGFTYQAIADELGYRTRGAAAQDVTRVLKDRQHLLDDQVQLFVTLELERLDSLERAVQTVLRQASAAGEQPVVLRAVDRLLRVGERRAALLGLDAGGKVKNADDGPESFDEAVSALFAEMGDAPAS